MVETLPIPKFFRPRSVGRLWKVDYARVAEEADKWRERFQIAAAREDQRRVCLLLIDVQNTFCLPGFELFVAGRSGKGAVDDNRRLCRFLYRHLHRISRVALTLDTHHVFQIFHPIFLVDREGRAPAPHTVIRLEDLEQGRWRVRPEVAEALGYKPEELQAHARRYAGCLRASGKYDWIVWPYHALLGGAGHALVPAVEEAVFFHSLVRYSPPRWEPKGDLPFTEFYSVFGPEVDETPSEKTTARNRSLIEWLADFDTVFIAGQAMSHCVASSIQDLLNDAAFAGPTRASKLRILTDCMSPVVIPEAVDFTEPARLLFEDFARRGAVLTDTKRAWSF